MYSEIIVLTPKVGDSGKPLGTRYVGGRYVRGRPGGGGGHMETEGGGMETGRRGGGMET